MKSIQLLTSVTFVFARSPMEEQSLYLRMTDREAKLFQDNIHPTGSYVEWGVGGSTVVAVEATAGQICSVESDLNWAGLVTQNPKISKAASEGRCEVVHVDIGPVGPWGFPLNKDKVENWPLYITAPFTRANFHPKTVLVDGRFRPSCALASIIFAQEARLMIHDYNESAPERAEYGVALKYCDIIDRVDTLLVLQRSNYIDEREAVLDMMRLVNNSC